MVACCETLVLSQGRQLLRDALAGALQQQIVQGEKKGRLPATVPAANPGGTKEPTIGT
jgi:hypothetical protein